MTFSRTMILMTTVWVVLITALHAILNWDVLHTPATLGRPDRAKFKVGFLPVT
jgi:hypothetical protein